MIGRKLARMIQQCPANPAILIIGMNIQLINELISDCHESDRAMIQFDNPKLIIFQDMIAKILLIFIKEVTLRKLKFGK